MGHAQAGDPDAYTYTRGGYSCALLHERIHPHPQNFINFIELLLHHNSPISQYGTIMLMNETQFYAAPPSFLPMSQLRRIARTLGLNAQLDQTRAQLLTAITTYGD